MHAVLKKPVTQGFTCLLSGMLIPLAFAPYNINLLAFICLAILFSFWLVSSPHDAFIKGYLFGLGMFGIGVSWLHISINTFGGMHIIGAYVLTFLLVAFLALYPAFVGYFAKRWFNFSNPVLLIIIFPALWALAEWFRSWIFTGFPWLNIGYSQMDIPLASIASILGIYGASWILAVSAGLLVLVFQQKVTNKIIGTVALLSVYLISWLLHNHDWTERKDEVISVALIQGAIPQEIKWLPKYRQPSLELYKKLSRPHWGKDLIIWPETAIPAYYHQASEIITELHKLALAHNTNVLAGLPVKEQDTQDYYNSVVLLNDSSSFYHKHHLVPFGEYLPLNFLFGPIIKSLNIPMSNFSPGKEGSSLLTANKFKFGMSICYENIFAEEIIEALPEADILVNVSNDAWFGDSAAPHQHLQMARMRALETGRYMLRATNTGISAIINEKGKIVSRSPQFEPTALTGNAFLFTGMTPYAQFGNLPIIIFLFSLLLLAKYRLVRKTV